MLAGSESLIELYVTVEGNARARKLEWVRWGTGLGEGVRYIHDSI